MASSFPKPTRRPPGVARRVGLARMAILWEWLLVRLWRGASLAALFAGLALMGLWTWLPGLPHVLLLAAFAVAIPLVLWRDLRGVSWPGEEAALRRLELKSGFDHRPLLAIEDEFAGNERDAGSRGLFEMHRRRMAERIRSIRIGRPLSRVSSHDRYALRFVALLVLAAGAIAGLGEARGNLAALVAPDFTGSAPSGGSGEMASWITPPAYTGLPPLWLDVMERPEDGASPPISVPAGSELVVQVRGGSEVPVLTIGDAAMAFETAGPGSYQISHVLEEGRRFAVSQAGREMDARDIEIVADEPPRVALAEPPSETLRTALRLDVVASDDYGLDNVRARIRRMDDPAGEILEISVPLPQRGAREIRGPAFFNLMAHPWAGMEVGLVLTATDVIGQERSGIEHVMVMPERYFANPVARRLGEQRKQLVRDAGLMHETAGVLDGLSRDPAAYLDDIGVHLSLVTGARRLVYDNDQEAAREAVAGLMWDTALAVEEGPLAFSEQRVRTLQERLLQALSEGAPEAEINRLLDELRVAMDDYMRALSNSLRTDPGEIFDPTEALKAVGSRELTDLVDRIGELVRTGSRDQAQVLLTRLQEIMENISLGNLSDLSGSVSAETVEMIQTIRQLMADQQDLLDESFRMLLEEAPEELSTAPQAERQGTVRDVLQGLMGRMDEFGFETPRQYRRADRSMARAVRQLEADRPGHAVDHQTEALEYLRAGSEGLMRQLLQQAGEAATGDGTGFFSAPRDPIGRRLANDGNSDSSDIMLPDKGGIIRAREILDEIYRRAGEQYRAHEEREYLRRLLRRF